MKNLNKLGGGLGQDDIITFVQKGGLSRDDGP